MSGSDWNIEASLYTRYYFKCIGCTSLVSKLSYKISPQSLSSNSCAIVTGDSYINDGHKLVVPRERENRATQPTSNKESYPVDFLQSLTDGVEIRLKVLQT